MINVEQLWDLMLEGSDDLASELEDDHGQPPEGVHPQALPAVSPAY